jgi:hypothetical protein
MCRLKLRLLIALLTFGVGVFGVFLWIEKSGFRPAIPTREVFEIEPDIRGFAEILSASNGTYVTVQGFIDEKFLCGGAADSKQNICTTALIGNSSEGKFARIRFCRCDGQNKSDCADLSQYDPNSPSAGDIKIYDHESNLIDFAKRVRVTGRVSIENGKKRFGNPVERIVSVANDEIEIKYSWSLKGKDSLDGIFLVSNNSGETIYYSGNAKSDNRNCRVKQNGKFEAVNFPNAGGIKEQFLKPNELTAFTIPVPQNGKPFEAGFTFQIGDRREEKTIRVKVEKQLESPGIQR